MADYIYMMESRLTPEQQRAVNLAQEIARAHGMNLYLTGGTIRDIISGFAIRDVDLTVEGNPFKLQRDLEKAGAEFSGGDERIGELLLRFPGNIRVTINMARTETYGKPGKPPEISAAGIVEDLRRRDFTVNAMGLSMNPGSRGLLLDPANGVADIEAKVLRILHNYSFLEDPSRLIRATHLTARFHWTLEERTQARYNAAIEGKYIEHINERSLGQQIEALAYEEEPLAVMRTLEKEGWLKVLHPRWSVAKADPAGLGQLLKNRQQMAEVGITANVAAAVLHFITSRMSGHDIAEIQKMIPRKTLVKTWQNLESDAKDLSHRLSGKEAATPSRAWKLLTTSPPDTLVFLLTTGRQQAVLQKIKNFLGKWRQVKQRFPLPEMAELRITPEHEQYPKLVEEMFFLMLDGKLRSSSEIIKFLKPYSPPPPPPPPPPPAKRGRAAKKAEAEEAKGKEAKGKEAKGKAKDAVAAVPPPEAQPASKKDKGSPAKKEIVTKAEAPKKGASTSAKRASRPAKPAKKKPAKKASRRK